MDVMYTHAQKTAGKSVEASLEPTMLRKEGSDEKIKAALDAGGLISIGHMQPRELEARGHLDHPFFERAWKFTIVRNPWDRAVSLHWYLLHIDSRRRYLWHQEKFDDWCEVLYERRLGGEYEWHEGSVGGDRCDQQVEYMFPEMDYLIRFEDLQTGWKEVCEIIGRPGTKMRHENRFHPPLDYRSKYTPRTREIIEKVYADDIERFGYSF